MLGALLSCACLFLPVAGMRASAADDLYARIGERLALMRDVAAWKWHNGLPIEDGERETLVLRAAVEEGLRRQIRPESSRAFFRVQMEAAKDIQRYWFGQWQRLGHPPAPVDLDSVLRPRLLVLGGEILALLADRGPVPDRDGFLAAVRLPGLHEERAAELFRALQAVDRYDSRLEQILDTGVLRVGTTGDYEPFSWRPTEKAEEAGDAVGSEDAAHFSGVDIDMARDLAAALDVELKLVQTGWPRLMNDLAAGRFDIAMSGVSRTLSRARHAYFSVPYHVGGKTAIARCEDRRRFATLTAIDRPGVRVIVNPGGTNEAFLDGRLTRAEKVLHTDNRTIFAALAAGAADVMITDSIEVILQAARNPALCGTMGTTLSYQEKAYLMPQDNELKTFVDTWLELRLADGTVNGLLEKHMTAR